MNWYIRFLISIKNLKSIKVHLDTKSESQIIDMLKYARLFLNFMWIAVLHNQLVILFLEKTLESPLDRKEIQPVHPKGDQSWVIIGRTDVEAETPIIWPPDAKSWLIGKDPDMGILRATQWTWIWANQDIVENREAGMLQSILSKTSEFFTGYLLFRWIWE